jgi:Zn-dependent protease
MRDIFSMPTDESSLRGRDDNIELLKAWAGTSLAFAIALVGGRILTPSFVTFLIIAAVTCGIGFVLHELAHRVLARGYGAEAHFVSNDGFVMISIVLAFTGFFIAAPGAVWHRGYLTARQSGIIALGGPVANFVLAFFFLGLYLLLPGNASGPDIWQLGALIGFNINAWLGLFNLIPAGPFDGAKVLAWDWRVLAAAATVGVILVFILPRTMGLPF